MTPQSDFQRWLAEEYPDAVEEVEAPLSENEIRCRAAGLLAIVSERARRDAEARARAYEERIRQTIRQNRENIQSGKLAGAHLCGQCAQGYISGDLGRFCPTGKQEVLLMAGLPRWR